MPSSSSVTLHLLENNEYFIFLVNYFLPVMVYLSDNKQERVNI